MHLIVVVSLFVSSFSSSHKKTVLVSLSLSPEGLGFRVSLAVSLFSFLLLFVTSRQSFSFLSLFSLAFYFAQTTERGVCLFVCLCVVVGRLVLVGVDDDDDDFVFPSPLRGTSVS